ncbi:MAG TPA: ABC transporter substrate-binding protein, partial [Kofleriaceae bacterium]|nr:ABC transporter substrate-binding protein [Kofleriaceae bacterium]
LVRVNHTTFELEPWLADRWESSPDGRTHTLHIRPGVTWSDGAPFSADDVLFSLEVAFDPKVKSVMGDALMVAGEPIRAAAPDAQTVVFTYAAPFGPGLALLDNLWLLPKHKLEGALKAGTFADAWSTKTPPAEMVGIGPFVIAAYEPGQRVRLERNPRYWRKGSDGGALPHLDRLVLEVIPDDNAQILRLESGALDLTNNELRADDYAVAKRAADQGRLTLVELGVGPDADAFWFCLKPEAKKGDPRFAFVSQPAFRQAISHAVDREAYANTVYLGAAVPVWGPVTPGNKPWFWPDVPRYPHDLARARALLRGLGLEDRNGNGTVEDTKGTEARFTVMTQRGVTNYDRGAAFVRDELAKVGIALDVAPLEFNTMITRMLAADYDAMYYRPVLSNLDPAMTSDFWLSSGSARFWNLAQATPATEWERRIDTLMAEQGAALDPARRREIFNEVQRVFAENLPVLYFAAPRLYSAYSTRLTGATLSVLRPPILWNADTLAVTR